MPEVVPTAANNQKAAKKLASSSKIKESTKDSFAGLSGQDLMKHIKVKTETKLEGIRKTVFTDRYSLKDSEGKPTETSPEQMWARVAAGIAKVEKTPEKQKEWAQKFYNALEGFKFVPAGRILSGAGTDYEVTYFNCFVIPSPQDSRGGILESLSQLVEIQARSGGVGLNLSSLRPRGARVKKVNGISSGPVTWAGLYSYATHDVVQQGGSRRGATMLMLWDWHPDVEEFITVKQDLSKINGANLSICVSDAFMQAVKEDKDWELIYPDLKDPEYDEKWDGEIDHWKALGKKVVVYKTVRAKELWDMICGAAWRSAEPGLHFLERSNKRSNTWYFERLIATNPCGEQPLGAWSVCNLGAMNLSAYVRGYTPGQVGTFDYEAFSKDVKVAMRFLDNVIDDTYYFFDKNEEQAKAIRRTGLGIMGLGDTLIKMQVRYGSEESLPVIEKIFKTLRDSAYEASAEIASEKGTFPMFDRDQYLKGYHIEELPESIRTKIHKKGIRNAVLLTIAPTGTTSLISGVSSGVEPVYDFAFVRRDRTGEHTIYHPLFEEWKKQAGEEAVQPAYFASANDLTPLEHTKVQAVAQKYIDSSISKTVNAPNDHTVEAVKELYMAAYDMGLKGVTYMRDGSRAGVLEHIDATEKSKTSSPLSESEPQSRGPAAHQLGEQTGGIEINHGQTNGHTHRHTETAEQVPLTLRKRPEVLIGATYEMQSPVGTAFVTINSDENGNPFEVFINVGKAGSDILADAEALGRLITMALRIPSGYPPKQILEKTAKQLRGISGSMSIGFGQNRVRSLADAVAKVMEKHISLFEEQPAGLQTELPTEVMGASVDQTATSSGLLMMAGVPSETQAVGQQVLLTADSLKGKHRDMCPQCGQATFVHEEGCAKCYSCGHAEC